MIKLCIGKLTRHGFSLILSMNPAVKMQGRTRFRVPCVIFNRGGVEDTRLEAKDTKKSEAKAKDSLSEDGPSRGQGKDQGHSRKCFPKKKGLQKSFSGNLQFIGVARIFDWRGLNHKSHEMTSSKICLFFT